jgi:hypothetical protein
MSRRVVETTNGWKKITEIILKHPVLVFWHSSGKYILVVVRISSKRAKKLYFTRDIAWLSKKEIGEGIENKKFRPFISPLVKKIIMNTFSCNTRKKSPLFLFKRPQSFKRNFLQVPWSPRDVR